MSKFQGREKNKYNYLA